MADGGDRGEELTTALLLTRINLEKKRNILVKAITLPGSPHSPGRGGLTGLCLFKDKIAVANATQVMIVDPSSGQIERIIEHRLFGGIHTVLYTNGVLYVTATSANAILGFDDSGTEVYRWYAGDSSISELVPESHKKKFQNKIDFRQGAHKDQGLHINHIFEGPGGDLILSLGAVHKYYNLSKDKVLFDVPGVQWAYGAPTHDGIWVDEHYYYSRTSTGHFIRSNAKGRTLQAVSATNPVKDSEIKVLSRVGFLRGACHMEGKRFVVGQCQRLLQVIDFADKAAATVADSYPMRENNGKGNSIFGIINIQKEHQTRHGPWPELEVIKKRTEFMAKFLRQEAVVCDLGAGAQGLKKHIPGKTYIPVDCFEGPGTVVKNLDYEYNLPNAEIYVLSGLLEHLLDPYELIEYLCEHKSGRKILLSYGVTRKRSPNWKNDMGNKEVFIKWAQTTFTKIEAMQMFGDHIVVKAIL